MQRSYLIFLVILFSCSNKATKEDGFITTKSKFDYKIIRSANGGDTIQKGDIVKVQLRQFIDDSLMNSTYDGMPEYVKIDSTLREHDFSEILPFMRVNDSAICVFSTKEIIKRAAAETYPPLFLEKGKNIRVFFKIVNKFNSDSLGQNDYKSELRRYDSIVALKEKAGHEKAIASFDSLIQSVKGPLIKLPNGVYVQMLQKGKESKIKPGSSVAVVYKGMLVDGIIFETTTRQKPFVLRAGEGDVVEGFDSGITSLSFGDKAKIFIPAKLAYGANKAGDKIPAFSNLVFEVEVNTQ